MSEQLQKLLDAYSAEQPNIETITALLTELSDEQLAEIDDAAIEAYDVIRNGEKLTSENLEQLKVISDAADAIRSESGNRLEAATVRDAELTKLDEKVRKAKAEEVNEETGKSEEVPAQSQETQTEAPSAELVTASVGKRARVALSTLVAAKTPTNVVPASGETVQPRARLVAAADVDGFPAGAPIEAIGDLSKAVLARFEGMPLGAKGVSEIKRPVALLHRGLPSELVAGANMTNSQRLELLDYAADETRLPGGSLVAAAGYCAPSTVDYSLCPSLLGNDGFIDLPTIQIDRGGIRTPSTWSFTDIMDLLPNQILCESDIVAGTTKECVSIPCPTWTDHRLCVAPLCIEAEILMEKGWPEGINRFMEDALIARRRYINGYVLQQMAAASTAVNTVPKSLGASGSVLDALALQAAWIRDFNRTSLNFTVDGVAPHWLRDVIRSDIAKRQAVGVETVTYSDVDAQLASINVRLNWVYDWQSLAVKTGTGQSAAYVPPTAWPTTVQILLYPAGTFVKGVQDVVRLSAVYDSTNLKKNIYTKLFFEDAFVVIPRCYKALNIKIPLCINGATGPNLDLCASAEG